MWCGVWYWVWYWVGTGWVLGRAILGTTQPAARGGFHRQRSGPRKACRAWSGWSVEAGRYRGRSGPPCGPGRSPAGPSLSFPYNAASGPIKARFKVISTKVSQNGEVSPRKRQKACHSPYSQNGVKKSPLEILRFPFLVAFSHKELIDLF